MIKEAYRLNIDLPSHPKGTVIYHEYEVLPSKFRSGDTYTTEGKWFTEHGEYIGKVQVWPWIAGLIETCMSMRNWEPTAKRLVTPITEEGGD